MSNTTLGERFGRFLRGEPVFRDKNAASEQASTEPSAQPQNNQSQVPAPDPTKTSVDARGYKIIPELRASNLVTRRNGNTMYTSIWITNDSDELIQIDSTHVGGYDMVHRRQLAPRQGFEFKIYEGTVKQSEHDSHARIVYRLVRSDDLFQTEYHVEYNHEPDGAFTLEELHEDTLRDI